MENENEQSSRDVKLAALKQRLEESRKERKRSDERLDELQRQFEVAHRRLRRLARSA